MSGFECLAAHSMVSTLAGQSEPYRGVVLLVAGKGLRVFERCIHPGNGMRTGSVQGSVQGRLFSEADGSTQATTQQPNQTLPESVGAWDSPSNPQQQPNIMAPTYPRSAIPSEALPSPHQNTCDHLMESARCLFALRNMAAAHGRRAAVGSDSQTSHAPTHTSTRNQAGHLNPPLQRHASRLPAAPSNQSPQNRQSPLTSHFPGCASCTPPPHVLGPCLEPLVSFSKPRFLNGLNGIARQGC